MFKKGDKVIIKLSGKKSEVSFIEESPTSLLSGKIYYLKGYSNIFFYEKEIEIDKQEVRKNKLDLILNNMVKYGDSNTYSHKLDDEKLRWLVSKTNRSVNQTQFLFNLVDGDFYKLKKLEEKIKNTFYGGCPSTQDEVEGLMARDNISVRFSLDVL